MDEKYDVIVLGTGLKKKVLHLDRNSYYGGESTSLTPLEDLFEHFGVNAPPKDTFGRSRDWNVDLIPKFLMGDVHTGVTKYINFKVVDGSYVFKSDGKVCKVPANEKEALASSLMGLFQKRKFRKFLIWAVELNESDPKTFEGQNINGSIIEIFKYFGLDDNTQDIIGHAICLYRDESYKKDIPAIQVVEKIKLYCNSIARFSASPYLYPLYGLGELPQGFARLSAVYGGTYMLNKPIEEIVMENGKVFGVKSEGETARCDKVICDPSYVPDRVNVVGQVVRAICILDHPIASTNNSASCQIILPQNQCGRKHDIYVSMVSSTHQIAAQDYYVALVATTVETGNPEAELEPGLRLLGNIKCKFTRVYPIYAPKEDPAETNIYISTSYDATTHFETTCDDVIQLWKKVTGEEFNFDDMSTVTTDE